MAINPQTLQVERDIALDLAGKLRMSATRDALYGQLCSYARLKGYKQTWADHQFEKLFGGKPTQLFAPEMVDWVYQCHKVWGMEQKLDGSDT